MVVMGAAPSSLAAQTFQYVSALSICFSQTTQKSPGVTGECYPRTMALVQRGPQTSMLQSIPLPTPSVRQPPQQPHDQTNHHHRAETIALPHTHLLCPALTSSAHKDTLPCPVHTSFPGTHLTPPTPVEPPPGATFRGRVDFQGAQQSSLARAVHVVPLFPFVVYRAVGLLRGSCATCAGAHVCVRAQLSDRMHE